MAPALYYSAYHWRGGPEGTAARIAALHEAGIPGVELGSRERHEPGLVEVVRGARVPLLLHNYFPPPRQPFVFNLASADATVRDRSCALAETAIALSADVGAPCYAVHAGFVSDPTGFDGISFVFPEPTTAQRDGAMDRFIAAIARLDRAARAAGVQLLVENNVCPVRLRDRLLLQTTVEFTGFFAALPTGHGVGVLLDTGHLTVTARTYGFAPSEFVRIVGARIVALHLHDNDGLEDRHAPLQPDGQGLTLARSVPWVRWVTLEGNCSTIDDISAQLALVRAALGD